MIANPVLAQALDVSREPASNREKYGLTLFGQSVLAARRLVEIGVRVVTVFWDTWTDNNAAWDTHANHHPRLKDGLLPKFDQTLPAFLDDMESRGLLDDTLVLVISEHGRTPRIDNGPKGGGRGHWSRAYSQVYAGGGMGRGNLIGSTDKIGGDVQTMPISPKDILATAFYLLGVDPHTTFPDPEGRPMPITGTGEFRKELLD